MGEEMLRKVENATGVRFDFETVCEIVRYTALKLRTLGKDAEYFPVLLESELRDHAARTTINMKGEINCVRNMPSVQMQLPMPERA